MSPISFGVVGVILVFGVNGVAVAHRLLWRRSPTLFWLASTLIVVGLGYIVVTGAAENVARSLWPVPFDPVKTQEFNRHVSCEAPRLLATSLILTPVLLVVPFLLYKFG